MWGLYPLLADPRWNERRCEFCLFVSGLTVPHNDHLTKFSSGQCKGTVAQDWDWLNVVWLETAKIGEGPLRIIISFHCSFDLLININNNEATLSTGMEIVAVFPTAAGNFLPCLLLPYGLSSPYFSSHPAKRNICPEGICVIWAFRRGFLISWKNCPQVF
jgi:hypothetical protein